MRKNYKLSRLVNDEVSKMVSNYGAFAALTFNNEVITWGDSNCGGNAQAQLRNETVILFYFQILKAFSFKQIEC